MKKCVIGIDFGSDSCRAVLADAQNGAELDCEVFAYPRWQKGYYCDPKANRYRQHPLDYIEGLTAVVTALTRRAAPETEIAALCVDTTGSTPCAVDERCVPLALKPEFAENPNAMFILWKDHTAMAEAAEINAAAKKAAVDYTQYAGGVYSSEWFFAKVLHVLREDEAVRNAAYTFAEHCDWIPALLTGLDDASKLKRGRCAAGHKAMWNAAFGGFPPREFFAGIDPLLEGVRARLNEETYTAEHKAGVVTDEWARKLGLPAGVAVGMGAFDAHIGAVGGGITPRTLLKVMGTSTCDVMVVSAEELGDTLIGGICGQTDGSVVPGYIGLEAGQSAYGDVYAWFKRLLMFPLRFVEDEAARTAEKRIMRTLEEEAEKVDPRENPVLALDWFNGRRTPWADQSLTGAVTGLTLGADAAMIYRSLLEATAYGARAIADQIRESGVRIDAVAAIGGICKKSPLSMQIVADVLNLPVKVCKSEQTVALGAAIFAAAAGGLYSDVPAAQKAMASTVEREYYPRPEFVALYEGLYQKYRRLGRFEEEERHA